MNLPEKYLIVEESASVFSYLLQEKLKDFKKMDYLAAIMYKDVIIWLMTNNAIHIIIQDIKESNYKLSKFKKFL